MEKTNYEKSSERNINLEGGLDEIDLKDLWNGILRKKKWLFLTAGIIFFGSVVFSLHARIVRPIYRGSFTLLIIDPMDTDTDDFEKKLSNSRSKLFAGIVNTKKNYEINTLITFLKSPIFLEPIAKEFNLSVGLLKNNISLDQTSDEPGGTSKGILNVYFNFKNPQIGELILQTIAKNYLSYSLEQKQKRLSEGLNFLNQQRPEIQNRKDLLQAKLVNFREKYKLIEPKNESSLIKGRQEYIEKNILNLTKDRNRLETVRKEIKKGTLTARGLSQEMGDGLSISDFDQGLLQELINVENELAKAKSKYTKTSSVVIGLQKRLEKIQPLLLINQLEAVDTALKLNRSNLISFKNLKKDIENKFLEQPLLIKKYQNIAQGLEIANENLLSLVSARESFQLEMAQNSVPWRIISKPKMGTTPIKPNLIENLIYGLIGGIFTGAVVASIRDRQNHVFNYPGDVAKDLNYTLLGNLPHVGLFKELRKQKVSVLDLLEKGNLNDKKIDSYQRFFFQEAFRNLYTSIRFLDTTQDVKTLVLTSSLPKEGKTLTNILLAKTISDLGVKVLLIDADLRKPQIHFRLGLNNLRGFSNLLTDPEMKVEDVVNKIKNHENWDVITGGTLPPDPTRLLGSQRFKSILEKLKKSGKYEIILLDSPPVLGLADSLLIAEETDGVIILIGLGAVDRSLPKEAINKIKSLGFKFYGLVTNQTITDSKLDKTYGYSKYGGYKSYGYFDTYYPISTYENYNQNSDQENISSININEDNSLRTDKKLKEKQNKYKIILKDIKKSLESLLVWLEN